MGRILQFWSSLTQANRETLIITVVGTVLGGIVLAIFTGFGKFLRGMALRSFARVRKIIGRPASPRQLPEAPDKTATPPEPFILRPPDVGFVSRAGTVDGQSVDIVADVKEKLNPSNNSWVTLWGKGGVGKTTLGKEIARQWKEEYRGRVVFSDAAEKVDYTRESLLKHIFKQLRGSEAHATRQQTEEAEAHALVAQSPTLILIDTYELVMPKARKCIMEWLEEARCVALFTSHERVDHTTNITVPSMSADEAHELIRRLFSNSSVLDKFNEDISRRISGAARRRPIFIEWLESQINILGGPPEKLLREMKQGRGDAAERIFDHFFNLPQLGEDGRVALLALSLFVPRASREALAAVAGFPGDEVRLTNALEILHRLKLVAGDNENERFALQSLTLVMTAARLATSPDAPDIWRRFTDYFNDPSLRDKEKSNVIRAIQTAACAHDWDSVVELYDATDEFMRDAFKSWVEAIRLAEEYAEQQISIEGRPRPRLVEIQHRDKGTAQEHYAGIEAKLGREEKPWRTVVRCAVKFELGVFACDCGDYALARELMQEAQTLQKKINHNFGVAMTCNNLGVVIAQHRQVGWKVEAMSKFQQAHKYFTDRAEEDSAQVRDRYAQSLCNIAGLGTDWKQGERFAKAVELNMRWLDDLP
jgi:ABC-type oligopeptide transport system ATPase subunit